MNSINKYVKIDFKFRKRGDLLREYTAFVKGSFTKYLDGSSHDGSLEPGAIGEFVLEIPRPFFFIEYSYIIDWQEEPALKLNNLNIVTDYYPNGNIKARGKEDSEKKRVGIWEWYFKNGQIFKTGEYSGDNGLRVGVWTIFDKSGKIKEQSLYSDAGIFGRKIYRRFEEPKRLKMNGQTSYPEPKYPADLSMNIDFIEPSGNNALDGSSWENLALFDFDHKALPVLDVFCLN